MDADVTIYALSGDASATAWLARQSSGSVLLTSLALAQIEAGFAVRPDLALQQAPSLRKLLALVAVAPFDQEHAAKYGALVRTLGFQRTRTIDLFIAAQALCLSATLVTNNVKDFADVPELTLEDWRLSPTPPAV